MNLSSNHSPVSYVPLIHNTSLIYPQMMSYFPQKFSHTSHLIARRWSSGQIFSAFKMAPKSWATGNGTSWDGSFPCLLPGEGSPWISAKTFWIQLSSPGCLSQKASTKGPLLGNIPSRHNQGMLNEPWCFNDEVRRLKIHTFHHTIPDLNGRFWLWSFIPLCLRFIPTWHWQFVNIPVSQGGR